MRRCSLFEAHNLVLHLFVQGVLNDCWLVASLQLVAQRCPQFMCFPRLVDYKGAPCVQMMLNIAGKAVEVIASAKLPVSSSQLSNNEYVLTYAHGLPAPSTGLHAASSSVLAEHGQVLWAAVVERLVAMAYGEVLRSTSVRPPYQVSLPTTSGCFAPRLMNWFLSIPFASSSTWDFRTSPWQSWRVARVCSLT